MARFDYAYSKGICVTAWVLQLLACLLMLGFAAFVLAVVNDRDFENEPVFLVSSASIWIGVTSVTIILDIAEIVLFVKKHLSPALYLSSACIKTFIWLILFVLSCISVSIIAIILCAVLLGTSLMQLIYTAKIVHRKRKGTLRGGNYSAANTGGIEAGPFTEPAPVTGYAPYVPGKTAGTSYASPSPLPAHETASQGAATEYYGGGNQPYEMYGTRQ